MWWSFKAEARLRGLEERIEKLEAELRTANLDWDNLYSKCRKLLGRTAKERATIEQHEQQDEAPVELSSPADGRFSLLTHRQRQIQQAILKRRSQGV